MSTSPVFSVRPALAWALLRKLPGCRAAGHARSERGASPVISFLNAADRPGRTAYAAHQTRVGR